MIDFLSEDYIDFTVLYNASTRQHLQRNPYIEICKVLEGGYAVIYVPRVNLPDFFDDISGDLPTFLPIIQGLMGRVDLNAAGILPVQNRPYLNFRGEGVLLGFVDTGIDYTSEAFQYQNGTSRIISIWDQTISGNPPEDYCYGTEYTRRDINDALNSEEPYSIVPHIDEVGHGTFMAAAAGSSKFDNMVGAAPATEFVVVKLTGAKQFHRDYFLIPEDQTNAYSSSDIMMGLDYLVNKAAELNRPIAISIGLGANFTGHHGYTLYERYVSNLARQRDVFIAVAAGNESNAGRHMMADVAQGGSTDIEIHSGENEPGFGVSIWTYIPDRISVAVTSPLGERVSRVSVEPALHKETKLKFEATTIIIEYYYPMTTMGAQVSIVKLIAPTPGIWTVTVYGDNILSGQFHAWLPITGFVDPETVFLSPNPYYTITSPATAFNGTACGAYSAVTRALYVSSSWGPDRFEGQLPHFVAPGVNVTGVYPWGFGTMTGTSVSAAITAGAGALMLQWGKMNNSPLNSVNIRTHLIFGCTQRPGFTYPNYQWGKMNNKPLNSVNIRTHLIFGCTQRPGFTYPNYQWGYGELNLIRAFEFMREVP